jgi:hypothetical protein
MAPGWTLVLAAALALAPPVCGQDARGDRAAGRQRSVRFLAVGDPPPYRQEVRDGVRRQLPPPPGSIPPRELLVDIAAADRERPPESLRLQLGRMSAPLPVPAGESPLRLRPADSGADARPWLEVRPPPGADFTVVLWRRDPRSGWDEEPRALVLPGSAPAGTLTMVNLAEVPVAVVLGTEKIGLPPRLPQRRPLPPGKPLGFQYALSDGEGRLVRQFAASLEQPAGDRTLLVIYRADGEKPRRPLGLLQHRERADRP